MKKKPDILKISHIITGLSTGGAEIMLLKLISGMDKTLFSNSVISLTKPGDMEKNFINAGIPTASLNLSPAFLNPLALLRLIFLLRKEKPDIIQGWMYHANIASTAGSYISGLFTPVLWNIRSCLDEADKDKTPPKRIIKLSSRLSRSPAAIIYNSRMSKEQHRQISFNNKKAEYIPNGFNCLQFTPNSESRLQYRNKFGISDKTICIGLIARYHPVKDHENFLRAAELLTQNYFDLCFVLIGKDADWQNGAMASIINELNIRKKILPLGKQNNIHKLINILDIAVSSSYIEGFSNAIGEAMASCIPCVVTDVGDSAYLVKDTGLIVPPRNPYKLYKALKRIINMGKEERSKLGKKARKKIEDNFSLEHIVEQYQKLYRKIIYQNYPIQK
ncbi:MAG: glycosyltransferase [Deltaproteobacteria bacterium]|nr:glycosyltransferase [Deltaproteobacteria bacterium]